MKWNRIGFVFLSFLMTSASAYGFNPVDSTDCMFEIDLEDGVKGNEAVLCSYAISGLNRRQIVKVKRLLRLRTGETFMMNPHALRERFKALCNSKFVIHRLQVFRGSDIGSCVKFGFTVTRRE